LSAAIAMAVEAVIKIVKAASKSALYFFIKLFPPFYFLFRCPESSGVPANLWPFKTFSVNPYPRDPNIN
jgi:hypothetical protein